MSAAAATFGKGSSAVDVVLLSPDALSVVVPPRSVAAVGPLGRREGKVESVVCTHVFALSQRKDIVDQNRH